MKYSNVKVSSKEHFVSVKVTSDEKPKVSDLTTKKWQGIIDLLSLTANVPSALIMRLEEKHMAVFLSSNTNANPYKIGEKAELLSGLYCETVVGNKACLLVPNALKDPLWEGNPDVKLNMISYLGLPIIWPDGEIFGTICVLDNKENHYNKHHIKLIELLKDSIEKDLQLALEEKRLKKELKSRKVAEKRLIETETMYRELFNNMGSAVIIYNVKNEGKMFVFKDLNKAAELIEKINKADIIGKDIKECFPAVSQSDLLKTMKQVWKTGIPNHIGNIFYEDNRIKGWRDNYYIYKLSSEEIVVVYDDISEKMEHQKIINETLELEKLKTEFFANISHELKTPLNIILGTTKINEMMIQDEENYINKGKIINNINIEKQNSFRLLRLINNLIDLTKIDSKDIELNKMNYNIVDLVEEITQSVVEYINDSTLTITFDTDIEEKAVACDLDKIQRIMLNLLSNSVKFTEPGGSIFVNVIDGEEYITITVQDTGIGISSDKLAIIFDRFRQVDKSFTRNNEGSGIGLSIVKSLVEMHEGTIFVESEYGVGTKFVIRLPIKLVDYENVEEKTKLLNDTISNCVEKTKIEFSDIY